MKYLLLSLAILFNCFLLEAQNWKSEHKSESLEVFSTVNAGNTYKTYKGVMRVPTTSDAILDIMRDVASYKQWTHGNVDSKVLKPETSNNIVPKTVFDNNSNYTFYIYSVNEGSPLDDRDAIVRVEMTKYSDDKVVLDIFPALDYLPKQDGLVRLKDLKASWVFERDPNDASYAIITHSLYNDPDVPMWVPRGSVNSNTYDVVKKTLENLRKRL